MSKLLSLGKIQINLAFRSLKRDFGFAEVTHARKNPNKFGVSLTKERLWLRRSYSRSEKSK